ncbi:MAG TPA: arsenic resistance N-acetyltransferase ArsN2 [Steroidobacter sp.]
MTTITARPSLPVAVALLKQAGLPSEDLTEERLEEFFQAGDPTAPLGIVGLELSPPHGLLRSLVVDARARSGGLGSRLLTHAEAHARSRGVRSLYLLTTTAEAFFAARGYARADRSEAPPFIRSSAEFTALCPASAAFMVKRLAK